MEGGDEDGEEEDGEGVDYAEDEDCDCGAEGRRIGGLVGGSGGVGVVVVVVVV